MLVNELVKRGILLIALKQNIDLSSGQHDMSSKIIVTVFSLLAELERDLISMRTKEALSVKKSQSITLGKPKGTIQKSKFDADLPRIKESLSLGLSVRKIADLLGYSNHFALNTYPMSTTESFASNTSVTSLSQSQKGNFLSLVFVPLMILLLNSKSGK